jgi:hypothetical protein
MIIMKILSCIVAFVLINLSVLSGQDNNKVSEPIAAEKLGTEDLLTSKDILEKTFKEWKGERDQVDDVLVIGIHL